MRYSSGVSFLHTIYRKSAVKNPTNAVDAAVKMRNATERKNEQRKRMPPTVELETFLSGYLFKIEGQHVSGNDIFPSVGVYNAKIEFNVLNLINILDFQIAQIDHGHTIDDFGAGTKIRPQAYILHEAVDGHIFGIDGNLLTAVVFHVEDNSAVPNDILLQSLTDDANTIGIKRTSPESSTGCS